MAEKQEKEITKADVQNKSLGRHLGTTIRQLRLQHNLTIAAVAEKARKI